MACVIHSQIFQSLMGGLLCSDYNWKLMRLQQIMIAGSISWRY